MRWKIAIRENNTDDGHLQHLDLEDVELVIFEIFSKSVSKTRGGPPKSSILIWFSIIFTIHFGFFSPYFRKHPNGSVRSPKSLVEKVAGITALSYMTGGFKYFLFLPLLGEMIQFDQYFSDGLKPPTR